MRARSIKPGICDNEVLGTADPFYTLLFERLWMIADRDGRLEDRPLRIKAQAFPYRDGLDVEPMLAWLADQGFIARYKAGQGRYIQILAFAKHQNPHKNEVASALPPIAEESQPLDEVVQPLDGALGLTPSSLTPDSGLLTPDCVYTREDDHRAGFDRVKNSYPTFNGRQDWINAEHHCRIRLERDGLTWDQLAAAVARYRAYCDAGGVSSSQYVLTPGKFFSAEDRPWMQEWKPPPSKSQAKQDKNISVAQRWLDKQNDVPQ